MTTRKAACWSKQQAAGPRIVPRPERMTMTTDQTTALYDAIDAFQRTHRLPGLQHAQIRGLLAEHLARALPAAVPVPPPTNRAALRDRIAEALAARFSPGGSVTRGMRVIDPHDEDDPDPARRVLPIEAADAVMPVLPETVDRAAVLLWAADRLERNNPDRSADFSEGVDWALDELRRVAAEEQPTERPRCPHCQLPHDLTPGSLPVAACASIRAQIAAEDAARPVVGEQPDTQETP